MGLQKELTAGPPFLSGIWWFDEKGQENLTEAVGENVEKWFFRQLGQVKLKLQPHLIEISWDTTHAHTKAIEAVIDRLATMDMNVHVQLNFFYHGWGFEEYQDTFWALERIEEIQDCRSVALINETRLSDCTLSDINYATPQTRENYQCWEKTNGHFEKADQDYLARLLPKLLMFGADKRGENLFYSWVGRASTAVRVYGEDWMRESAGQVSQKSFGVESQNHADKVTSGIEKTLITGEPSFQHIRALMCVDDEPIWVTYERLLTRHYLRGGMPVVVVGAFPTQNVDIPLAGCP